MSTKLSLDEKNAMCTASIRYGGMGGVFDYTRKNISKRIVTYYCTHNRKCGCKAKLELRRDKRRVTRHLHDIDMGVVKRPTYNDVTIPSIPRAYTKWVEDNSE